MPEVDVEQGVRKDSGTDRADRAEIAGKESTKEMQEETRKGRGRRLENELVEVVSSCCVVIAEEEELGRRCDDFVLARAPRLTPSRLRFSQGSTARSRHPLR